jgi:hypothetical protein
LWRDPFDWVYREYDWAVFPLTIHLDVSGRPQVLLMLERLIEYISGHSSVRWCTMEEMAQEFRRPRSVQRLIRSPCATHEGRDTGIRKMFENLFENYKIILHKDFTHVVDVESNACSAQFNVELTDPAGKLTKLSNCNFFYLDDAGKFKRVFVYMSGPNVLV